MRRGAAALLLAGAVAACGGGSGGGTAPSPSGPALTTAQLVAQVNAECAKLSQAGNDLTNAEDPSAKGGTVERFLHAAATQLRDRVTAIARLRPPKALAGQLSRFVSVLGRYADQLDALASQTRSGDTFLDLLGRSSARVNALNQLSDQSNRIAATLGFTACAT